jgi:hypothetical protein
MKKINFFIIQFIFFLGYLFCAFYLRKTIENPENIHLLFDGTARYIWRAKQILGLILALLTVCIIFAKK